MKSKRVNGTAPASMLTRAGLSELVFATEGGAVNAAPVRMQQALATLGDLKAALATGQGESNAARQQIDAFTETIAGLRQKVIRLEQEVARVSHFAYHDELTGLANRSLLLDRLSQAIAQAARQHKHVGLLLLDLDGFKSVNDRLGHAIGDELLKRVAQRLLSGIRGADTACRFGGDEFVILLPDVDGEKSAGEVAQKLHSHLAKPYIVEGQSITVTASIGVAVYPRDGKSQDDLIRQADIAMYLAKDRGNAVLRPSQPTGRT